MFQISFYISVSTRYILLGFTGFLRLEFLSIVGLRTIKLEKIVTMDEEDYNTSSSEENYSKEDKFLLENARSSMRKKEVSSDEEVFRFGDSDSNEEDWEEEKDEEQEDDMDMGSDLEDEERVLDDRAWGKKKRSFYSTDFVDQDYEGIYQGKEAEIAELEEQEARNIQKRLAEQLNDADFSVSETVDIAEVTDATTKQEVIISDLSKLTKRQKLDLVKKESPEFFVLVQDFKDKIQEAQRFLSVITYFKERVKQTFPALDFLQIKLTIILNYCINISYYLLLKAKRIPIKNHPVLKSLFRYRQLLEQLEDVDRKIIQPQVDEILAKIESGKEILIKENLLEKKTTLKVLTKQKLKREKEAALEKEKQQVEEEMELEDDEVQENQDNEVVKSTDKKRPITYEMAKNKGLIPKRSKEQRNPRVKHRRKYEKAKIRRRGQVRTPRAEIPVYGGEPTGIKIGLTKSIKLKN